MAANLPATNPRDVDAARTTKDGKVMLGPHAKERCFHISEVDVMLGNVLAKRQREHKPVSEELKKAMAYCKRFKSLRNDVNALYARQQLLKPVEFRDSEGYMRRMKRCREFEAAQLINLMPATAEEAVKLIPTLEGNQWLSSLVADIQPMRDFDRGIA